MTPFSYLKIYCNHIPPAYAMLIINAQILMFFLILIINLRAIPPNGCQLCPQDIIGTNMLKNELKIHFNIKQSVLHINLTANFKYII